MATLSLDFTVTPMNDQSKIIEERSYGELVDKARDSFSVGWVYVQQVPNVKSESKVVSTRMARFKKAGLIGCFNDTGVNSDNYKEILRDSYINKKTDS
jgi:hypothetical protein